MLKSNGFEHQTKQDLLVRQQCYSITQYEKDVEVPQTVTTLLGFGALEAPTSPQQLFWTCRTLHDLLQRGSWTRIC